MKLPTELTTVTLLSKIMAIIVFVVAVIVAFMMGRNYQKNLHVELPKEIHQPEPTPTEIVPTLKPTETILLNIVIPSEWNTYNKAFGEKFHVSMRYPTDYIIDDADYKAGPLRVMAKSTQTSVEPQIMYIDTAKYHFGITDVYTGGSLSEWFLSMLKKYKGAIYPNATPIPLDYSDVKFREINFPNAESFVEVSNFPEKSDLAYYNGKGSLYITAQDGIIIGVLTTIKDKALTETILSSLEITKPQ